MISTKRLTLFFLITQISAIAVLASTTLWFDNYFHERLANISAGSVRNKLIAGDLREAIIALGSSFSTDFNGVAYFTNSNERIFSLPASLPPSTFRSYSTRINFLKNFIEVPILFNDGDSSEVIGKFIFFYDRLKLILLLLILSLIIVALGMIIFLRERRLMIAGYEQDRANTVSEHRFLIAKQVAHDIRSPLSALDIVMRTETSMPEERRVLARSAISRINDIANHLLERNRPMAISEVKGFAQHGRMVHSIELLASIIDSLISEKRIQFRSKLNVELEYHPGIDSYGLFSSINPTEFKRMLSNLINNAVEALPNFTGRIVLQLSQEMEQIIITIADNGKGIPAHVLPKLGFAGASFGKEGTASGAGLGLFHARQTVESFGGILKIDSSLGKGTRIQLVLPKVKSPDWFVEVVKVKFNSRVVVVDDDVSIHKVWQERFDSLQFEESGVETIHFSTPGDLQNWVESQISVTDVLFLIDYEFLGDQQNGLEIIKTLGLSEQSILVTSRYEEPLILASVESVGVRLIPKRMASIVPIELQYL